MTMVAATCRLLPPVLAFALGACGDEGASPPPEPVPTDPCPAPNRLLDDGRCLEPGVQNDGCAAGTLGLGDGTCQAAGIPASLCADGFDAVGDGCEPVLPAEPCIAGLMAVPGESTCRAVMSCGSGPWGDLPVDGSTVYVDAGYPGADSDGSEARPWTAIGDAVVAAGPDALVAVAAGRYAEDVILGGKPIRLWGVCPDRVEIVGSGVEPAAVQILTGTDGLNLGGVAVTGAAGGVELTGATDVTIERVWVHDTAARGVAVSDNSGAASVTLRDSLIEAAAELGVRVAGAEATIARTVVRGTRPRASDQGLGRGINVRAGESSAARATLTLQGSVVANNREIGVFISGSDATVEGTVVRDTQSTASDQTDGVGIAVQSRLSTGAHSTLALSGSLVERNHYVGVLTLGSVATIEGTVVRGTEPQASTLTGGYGVHAQHEATADAVATLQMSSSLVEHNHHAGVLVLGADGALEAAIVRATQPIDADSSAGIGVAAANFAEHDAASTLSVQGSLVEANRVVGLFVLGSAATVQGTVVRDTSPRASDQLAGGGITVQDHPDTAARSTVDLRAVVVDGNHDTGVFVVSSDVTLDGCLITDTSTDTLGRFGDGVLALVYSQPADVSVRATSIHNSPRAAVSNFGSRVALESTTMTCQSIDLAGETLLVHPFRFDDLGANRCGCPVADRECDAESVGLQPPMEISPLE